MYPEHTALFLELVQLHKHSPGNHQHQLYCRGRAAGLIRAYCPILPQVTVQGLDEGPVRQQHTCVQNHIQPHSTCKAPCFGEFDLLTFIALITFAHTQMVVTVMLAATVVDERVV